jgi:hypothetical protein
MELLLFVSSHKVNAIGKKLQYIITCILFMYETKTKNCISGVMVTVSSAVRSNQRLLKLVFVASPLSMQH